jgi:hypothetical protein
MGEWANAKRHVIIKTFEAGSGDMQGDVEPIAIWRRDGSASDPVLRLEKTIDGTTMRVRYTVLHGPLDAEDVERLFVMTYLDELTIHYYRGKVERVMFVDEAGGEREMTYASV